MYDFVQKNTKGLKPTVTVENTKEKMSTFIKAAPALLAKNFDETKLRKFIKDTGLEEADTYEIAKTLLKIIPESSDIGNSVKFELNVNKENIMLEIDKKDKSNLTKAKKTIYDIVKPEEKTEIEGKLGIMEEWEYHKIVIIDKERNNYTINYAPTKELIQQIKDNIGKEVKIKREKDPTDNRKWMLVKLLTRGKKNEK